MTMPTTKELPVPPFFDATRVGEVWRVPYQERATYAQEWAATHNIQPAAQDQTRICLFLIDVQNTFCLPEYELFAGGQSGSGAIDDNARLCEFIYRNLARITKIIPTMDTHMAMQIFHPIFWINEQGEHPHQTPMTISPEEVENGVWKVNPAVADNLPGWDYSALEKYALHYAQKLAQKAKYPLTVWPYHAMVGSTSHALVSALEEALFFYSIARQSQVQYELKGNNPLTENYSALGPEVLEDHNGQAIAQENNALIEQILGFDAVIIGGQAKSHCVAWTVEDLLREIKRRDANLAQKIYLLEDCTSPVVIPEVVDYTSHADEAFERFAQAGMHRVESIEPMERWLNFPS